MTTEENPFTRSLVNGEAQRPSAGRWMKKLHYLQDFIEFSPIAAFTLDRSGNLLNSNLALTRLLKVPRSDLPGGSFYDYVAREDRDLFYLHLRSIFKNRRGAGCELILHTRQGKTRRVRMESMYALHPKGRAECRSMITDLTEIREAEAALQESIRANRRHLAQMDALFQQMTEGIFLFDTRWALTKVNQAGRRLWGYADDLPLNRPFEELVEDFEVFDLPGNPLPRDRYPFHRVLSGETLNGYEVRVHCKSTGRSWIGAYGGTPVFDEDGREMFYIVTVRDISAQHRARLEVEAHRNELRRLNETLEARVVERTEEVRRLAEKLRALAMEMSRVEQRERKRLAGILHDDLQQTLAAVQFQLRSCRRSDDVEKIRAVIDSALGMTRESIELSRNLSRELSPPVLKESGITEGVRWLAGRMAEQQGFTVAVHNAGAIEPIPEEIRFFLFECVREVLFNAVKHSGADEAGVILERDPNGDVRILVEDRGRGFDAAALADRDAADVTFGLFSIQERMAHLGGIVAIDSEPGKGCRVTLTAPVGEVSAAGTPAQRPRPAEAPEAPREEDRSGRIRILVVDDHTLVREGLVFMLTEEKDFRIAGEAADGREAIERADALRPDIVLMDVNLPEINGVEATRIIRERHPDIPVIGLSMHADEAVAESMREAGAAAYLTKDGPAETLVETIRGIVR